MPDELDFTDNQIHFPANSFCESSKKINLKKELYNQFCWPIVSPFAVDSVAAMGIKTLAARTV